MAGVGHLSVVGLKLGDRVCAGGQNEPARLGDKACRFRGGSSKGRGLGKASTLPGLCGGAALWTLLYHCVEQTLSAVRAFSWTHINDVSAFTVRVMQSIMIAELGLIVYLLHNCKCTCNSIFYHHYNVYWAF